MLLYHKYIFFVRYKSFINVFDEGAREHAYHNICKKLS